MRLGWWFTLALWLAALLLPWLFDQPGVWSALKLQDLFSWQTAFGGLSGVVIGGLVVALVNSWRPLRVVAQRLASLVAWDTFKRSDFVVIAWMAALGEEPLFRGVLQPLIGLAPTTILFGLLHATSVAHIILASLLGLGLGWLYQWSGSLWPPIAAHLTIDLVTALLLTRTLQPNPTSTQGEKD